MCVCVSVCPYIDTINYMDMKRLGWDDDCLRCNGLVYEFFQIKMATESMSLVVPALRASQMTFENV